MQIPPGVAFTIDQLGSGLERSQQQIAALQQRVLELEAELERRPPAPTPAEEPTT